VVWGERLDFKISPLLLHYSCLSEKISENGKVYNALALCSPGGDELHFGHMTMIELSHHIGCQCAGMVNFGE